MSIIDQLMMKIDDEFILKGVKIDVVHPLRKILGEYDAMMLGELLDAFRDFHDYNKRRDMDMERFVWLVEFNAIVSEPRYVKGSCPDRFRDVFETDDKTCT